MSNKVATGASEPILPIEQSRPYRSVLRPCSSLGHDPLQTGLSAQIHRLKKEAKTYCEYPHLKMPCLSSPALIVLGRALVGAVLIVEFDEQTAVLFDKA